MLEKLGLLGLFLGCMLSATIIPFSSDALVTGAILLKYDLWTVVFIAGAGNTVGGMISFLLGWFCKWEWLEKYFKVNRKKLANIQLKVQRYGYVAAFFSWLPLVGDLIAISMGLLRTKPLPTLAFMFTGKTVRYIFTAMLSGLLLK